MTADSAEIVVTLFILNSLKTLTPTGKEVFIELLVRRCFTRNILRVELPEFALGQQNLYSYLPFAVLKLKQLHILLSLISSKEIVGLSIV